MLFDENEIQSNSWIMLREYKIYYGSWHTRKYMYKWNWMSLANVKLKFEDAKTKYYNKRIRLVYSRNEKSIIHRRSKKKMHVIEKHSNKNG